MKKEWCKERSKRKEVKSKEYEETKGRIKWMIMKKNEEKKRKNEYIKRYKRRKKGWWKWSFIWGIKEDWKKMKEKNVERKENYLLNGIK